MWITSSYCKADDPMCVQVQFRKSSYSEPRENCVEAALRDGHVLVRDSKDPDGPVLSFTPDEWSAFILGAKDGEFDAP